MNPKELFIKPAGLFIRPGNAGGSVVALTNGTPFLSFADFEVVRAGVKPQPILHIRLEVVDGRIQVDRFGLASQEAGRPITAADLRYWDFDTVVRLVEQRVGEIASMRARAVADGVNTIEDLQAAVADGVAAADTHRTYRSIDADLLERVAEIVTANRQKPALAVRTEMSTTSRNASRWIAAARKQGFLPPLPKENN